MKIYRLNVLFSTIALLCSQSMTVLAVSEADVAAVGKEAGGGNLFVWFLCAIAFLKISQKIDSFMSSLGVNVGHTGGSMMAELMIAAKGLTTARNIGGSSFRNALNSSSSFLSGGLAGAVGRHFTQSAMQAATGQGGNALSRKIFETSMQKGGSFANEVTGAVAKGNLNYTGSMHGTKAAQALSSFLGQAGMADAPAYSNVEIGGGRITGTETSGNFPNGTCFGLYHTDQYMAPAGQYDTVTASDNSTWYRQYAADAVEKTPYMTGEGKIAYQESMVQRLPNMPHRKDRV